jgi:hypothetical protein
MTWTIASWVFPPPMAAIYSVYHHAKGVL